MDIRVYVEGVVREIGGVTDTTTCEEVIIKLAQASNLPGFYTLVAVYRGQEDTLSADEKILDFIRRIKDKPSMVQFVLRRLEAPPRPDRARLGISNKVVSSQTCSLATAEPMSKDPGVLQKEASAEAKQSGYKRRASGLPRTFVDQSEYEQLEDQLAYQEREAELNRIRLIQLDKEIAELERANRANGSIEANFAGGPATELVQLSSTPWQQLLEANRVRQRHLSEELGRYQHSVERVTVELDRERRNVADLEAKVTDGLDRLLVTVEAANAQRRQFLRSLSPNSARSRPAAKTDGVPV